MKSTLERAYGTSPKQLRDQLVMENLDYVGRILSTMTFVIKDPEARENLHSAGVLGLVQAAAEFDPTRGAAFRTYAYRRIRGAIVDEMRKQSPVSPRVLRRIGVVKQIYESLEPPVTPEQLAERSGLSVDEIVECLEAMRFIKPDRWSDLADVIDQSWRGPSDLPEELVEREEMVTLVADLIQQLPERERLTLTLYYSEELNLAEIGEVLGLSESRVSRLLASARFQLKESIRWRTN
jgi:RNA polymerase sigma factor for flagellar operon FliA